MGGAPPPRSGVAKLSHFPPPCNTTFHQRPTTASILPEPLGFFQWWPGIPRWENLAGRHTPACSPACRTAPCTRNCGPQGLPSADCASRWGAVGGIGAPAWERVGHRAIPHVAGIRCGAVRGDAGARVSGEARTRCKRPTTATSFPLSGHAVAVGAARSRSCRPPRSVPGVPGGRWRCGRSAPSACACACRGSSPTSAPLSEAQVGLGERARRRGAVADDGERRNREPVHGTPAERAFGAQVRGAGARGGCGGRLRQPARYAGSAAGSAASPGRPTARTRACLIARVSVSMS